MAWAVILHPEVEKWLAATDEPTDELVTAAIEVLKQLGPALGRPLVDTISGSTFRNMKELRPGSTGRSEVRILFAFDPHRQAILLVAGDKQGQWTEWYAENIPFADARLRQWLAANPPEPKDKTKPKSKTKRKRK